LQTIADLAAYVAVAHPGWHVPDSCWEAHWREAQVFAGVRACLVEAANVDPDEVVRPARLQQDLGM
jgi:hypothetical protein